MVDPRPYLSRGARAWLEAHPGAEDPDPEDVARRDVVKVVGGGGPRDLECAASASRGSQRRSDAEWRDWPPTVVDPERGRESGAECAGPEALGVGRVVGWWS